MNTFPESSVSRTRFTLPLLGAALMLLCQWNLSSAAAERQVLKSHVPAMVRGLQPIGRLSAETSMDLAIGLPLRNRDALTNLLQQIYDPRSPLFHHYLTPQEFTERFGPTAENYEAVVAFAEANGFRVTKHPNRMIVDAVGPVAAVEKTLHVNMRLYQHPKDARTFYAPDTEPSLDLAVPVLHVAGLDNSVLPVAKHHRIATLNGSAGAANAPLDSRPKLGSGPNGTYMGYDFRAAYVPGTTLTGAGQTVALFELDGYFASDITAYENFAGLPNVPLQNVLLNGFNGAPGFANVEVALDIEVAIAMAPGISQVLVYEGFVPTDIINRIATDNIARQISCSWGWSPFDPTIDQIFQEMAIQGQSFLDASGDDGADFAPIFPPSDDPYITQVGGTTLSTSGPLGDYVSETVWNWGGGIASSGGTSGKYPIPTWQMGIDMSTNGGSASFRNFPDVALTADNIFIVADNGFQQSVGGTSAAAPLWAGFLALVNQQAEQSDEAPVGFINPAVYAIAQSPNYANGFHDIIVGNNTNFISTNLFYAFPGYDLCTGWGTPAGTNLINLLAKPVPTPVLRIVTNYISGGNGNGMIDPNECNDLFIVLTNIGSLGASNVTARLSTTTPGVILAQRTSPYPDIPIGGGGTNLVPFKISTTPTFICGTPVVISMVIKSDEATKTNTLRFNTGILSPPVRFDSVAPVPIPDNNPAGANSFIVVSNMTGAIGKVTVSVYITHTFDSDLQISLVSPDGTNTILSANEGSSGDNFGISCAPDANRTTFDDGATNVLLVHNPPFLGAFKPDQLLSVFIGKTGTNVNGVWALHVVDQAAADVGTIQCWSLNLQQAVCADGGSQCPGVDLSIGMTANPEPVFVGNNLVYTISVTNAGPDLAKNVIVSQSLPTGVIYVSGSASQGSVSASGGVVTGNLGNMPAGSVATMTVTVNPTQTGLLSVTATVSSQNTDFDLSNNSVTVTSHVNPPFADLAVGLLDAPDPTVVGQTLTYTLSVTNRGPAPATFVTVTNVLPTTVGILNVTPSQGFITIVDNVVVCNFGSLANGAVATATINVSPSIEGTIVATATATAAQTDPITGNNVASATTVVGPSTDLAIGIVDVPDPVVLRSNLIYIISVTNRGPSSASGVVVNNTLPAGVSVVSNYTSQGVITASGSTVTGNLGNMTNGARATLTITVTSTNSGTIFDTANVTGDQADPDPSNNSASASTVVSPPFVSFTAERAVLTFESLSPTNGTVDPGETVTVNLYLRNAGNVVNTNLFATLLAINGVTSPSGPQNYGILPPSSTAARPFTFTASGAAGDSIIATLQLQDINIAQHITNNLGTVSFTFVLPSTVTFANTNRIDIPSALQDQQKPGPASPYPSPITVSGITGLVGKVTVTLSNLNHTFAHDINVLLVGPSGAKALLMSHVAYGSAATAVDLTFDDTAPAPLPASGGATSGAWQPSVYDPAPVFTNPAPAGPYNSVLSTFNGPITNGDWLLYANDDSDGDFGAVIGGWALTFTVLNPVNQIADLLAAASASPNPVLAGNNLTNIFSITNAGPNDASLVWVTNILSPNVALISADNSLHAPFTTNGNILLCNLGGLAAGASAKFTIVVSPTAAGLITNTASVTATSGEVDLNPANNSASVIVTANSPQADLGVSISANPNPVTVSSNLTATIVVTNAGPNAALNVMVSNALPAGVNYVSGTGSASQGTVSNLSGVIVANLGTIPANSSATITFNETSSAAGSITNTARVTALAADGNSANNSASAITTVLNPAPRVLVPSATLTSESVSPANGTLDAGETVTAAFTFTNSGAADTVNLVATLLATNGVTSPSGPVTVGALVHGGAAVSRSFTFTAGAAPSGVITATFKLQDSANDLGLATFAFTLPTTASFTNVAAIIIPDHGSASPYPSTIPVSGLTGLVGKVTVSLNGLTHGFPDDIDMILVSPSGQKVVLMSDTGGGHSLTNVNLIFDDNAAAGLPDSARIVSGTYKPTDFEAGDSFPPPAPAGAVSAFLSAFNGSNPNGNWSLYVVDDATGDSGLIAGWSLSITTINPANSAMNLVVTVTDSPDPVFVGSPLTYTVTLTNRGPSTATGVFLTDFLAPGVTLASSNTTFGTFALAPTTVTINVGTLTSGAGLAATLRVSASLAGVITNVVTATNSSAQVDLDPTSNLALTTTTVLSPLSALLDIAPVNGGQQLQITIAAEPGQIYTLQGSVNFTTWSSVFTGTVPSSGILKFIVANSSNYRFFRSVRVP
jgi:uncharacterized repeat protein (TIGR01451 family)